MTSNEVNEKLDKTADAISDIYETLYDLRASIKKICLERDSLRSALFMERGEKMTQLELNEKIERTERALKEAFACVSELRELSDPWRNVDDAKAKKTVSLIHYTFFNTVDEIASQLDRANDVFSSVAWTLVDSSEDEWKDEILDAINALEAERASLTESFSVERSEFPEEDAPYMKEDCATETDDWDVSKDADDTVVISTEKQETFDA